MPNTKSAAKRVRQDIKKRRANKARKTKIKTTMKELDAFIAEKDLERAREQLRLVFKAIDKAAKTNVIHKNKAARKKSQAARKVNTLAAEMEAASSS